MLWTDEILHRAMLRLLEKAPEKVAALAARGPMPEPACAVCTVLLDTTNEEGPVRKAALDIVMYHDEPTYDVDDDDYLVAIGLADLFTYKRCLRVYAMAEAYLWLAEL